MEELQTKVSRWYESVDYDIRMKELQLELADILRQEAKSRESVLNVFKSLGYEIEL